MGFFSKKKGTTITQEEMLTPEQKAALASLSSFSQTGKFGNYQAGEAYAGDLGDFKMTDIEQLGQNKLRDLVSGNLPEMFNLGADEIKKLLTTDNYDPYSETGVYKGFATNVNRAAGEESNTLARNLAVTGDLYSTENARQQGLLSERTTLAKQNKLAELYDTFAQRKLAGAETAVDIGTKQEAINQGRIGLSQSLGSLQRLLNDAQAKAQYADYLRGRTEMQGTIDAAKSVLAKDVPYGVKSFTTPDSASPFSNLLNAGLNLAGQAAGAYLTGGFNTLGSSQATSGTGLFSVFK